MGRRLNKLTNKKYSWNTTITIINKYRTLKDIVTVRYNLRLIHKIAEIGHNDDDTELSSDEDSDCRSLIFERFRTLRTYYYFLKLFLIFSKFIINSLIFTITISFASLSVKRKIFHVEHLTELTVP